MPGLVITVTNLQSAPRFAAPALRRRRKRNDELEDGETVRSRREMQRGVAAAPSRWDEGSDSDQEVKSDVAEIVSRMWTVAALSPIL